MREVNKAINLFKNKKIKSLVSVSNAKEHPYKYFRIKGNFWDFLEKKTTRSLNRQDFPNNYLVEDGNIYLSRLNFKKI